MPEIHGVAAFDDNYIWVISEANGYAAIVDPGDEEPVIEFLQQNRLKPAAILITHKHYDHVGGIAGLKAQYPEIKVFGPANEKISGIDTKLGSDDRIDIPNMVFSPVALDVPGHTEGHIAYYGEEALFCGDTLFACGCGRVFSGTMEQLHHSLNRIASLPEDTRVYCAHEYTLDNIGFAKWVEPENKDLLKREQAVITARVQQIPTVPSTIKIEILTNPFMRTAVNTVRLAAENYAGKPLATSEQVFTVLRQWKDREYD